MKPKRFIVKQDLSIGRLPVLDDFGPWPGPAALQHGCFAAPKR